MGNTQKRLDCYPLAENQPETANTRPRIHQLSLRQLLNFWRRVEKIKQHDVKNPQGCWHWTGGCNGHGRGLVKLFGVQLLAPRVMYALENGVDPGDWDILHTCDNPNCVNPKHFFLGTPALNAEDRARKGRFVASRGNTKVDLDDPENIALLLSGISRREKAKVLGITGAQVSRLSRRLGAPDGRRKVTVEQEQLIRSDGRPHTVIGYEYGISADRVSGIKRRPN